MLQKLLLIFTPIFLVGCAPMLLAPLSVAGAAAEQKTGKSPISTFLSRITGDDCDVKRVLSADFPCASKKQINEINQSTKKDH